MEGKTATFLRTLPGDQWTGEARLYRVAPPIEYSDWDSETGACVAHKAEFAIVSATCAMYSGPETYIFPADAEGRVQSWLELDGSYRGGTDHAAALEGAGYSVEAEAA